MRIKKIEVIAFKRFCKVNKLKRKTFNDCINSITNKKQKLNFGVDFTNYPLQRKKRKAYCFIWGDNKTNNDYADYLEALNINVDAF